MWHLAQQQSLPWPMWQPRARAPTAIPSPATTALPSIPHQPPLSFCSGSLTQWSSRNAFKQYFRFSYKTWKYYLQVIWELSEHFWWMTEASSGQHPVEIPHPTPTLWKMVGLPLCSSGWFESSMFIQDGWDCRIASLESSYFHLVGCAIHCWVMLATWLWTWQVKGDCPSLSFGGREARTVPLPLNCILGGLHKE